MMPAEMTRKDSDFHKWHTCNGCALFRQSSFSTVAVVAVVAAVAAGAVRLPTSGSADREWAAGRSPPLIGACEGPELKPSHPRPGQENGKWHLRLASRRKLRIFTMNTVFSIRSHNIR
jgi:hypothetical protein